VPLAGKADSPWAKAAMCLGGVVFGVGVILFGMAPSFWVAFAIIVAVGSATTVFQSLSNTLALELADDSHQGRVQSLMQLSFAGFGMAAAPLGLLAELIGLRLAIVVMGGVATTAITLYVVAEGGPRGIRPRTGSPVGDGEVSHDVAGRLDPTPATVPGG
jgi:predicted MFS family arabinose efflux permease